MNNYNNNYNGYGRYNYNSYNFRYPEYDLKARNGRSLSKIYSSVGLGLCVLFAISMVAQIFIIFLMGIFAPDILNQGWFLLFLTDVPMYCVALWGFLFFASKLKGEKPKRKNFGFGSFVSALPVLAFFMFSGAIVGNFVDQMLQQITGVELSDSLTETTSVMSLPVQIIFLVVIAPLGEELIFRKILLDRTARYGAGAAIMYSAITFALFHGNFNQLFYAFGSGLVLAYVYVRTGSYISCVILHGATNALFGVVFPYFAQILLDGTAEGAVRLMAIGSNIIYWLLIIAGLTLFIVFLACKKVCVEKSKYELLRSPASCAFSNAPFIVYAAVIGAIIFLSYIP